MASSRPGIGRRTLVETAPDGHRMYDKKPCKMASIRTATRPSDERGTDPDRGRRRYDEHKGRRLRQKRQGARSCHLADTDPLPGTRQGPLRARGAVGLLRDSLA